MTKKELDEMRDELRSGDTEWPVTFYEGFNACAHILWPKLLALSDALWEANGTLDIKEYREALKEHGVEDDS